MPHFNPNPAFKWNTEIDDALRKLRRSGVNIKDCADALGISHMLVERRVRTLRLNQRMNHGRKRGTLCV